MSHQLFADCLEEIFEYLEDDKVTLHSCILANRLCCETAVRILWRDIWKFKYSVSNEHRPQVVSAILNTLIACLPSESKELLHENEIFIATPTSKPLLFNYASFCKVLSINEIGLWLRMLLKTRKWKLLLSPDFFCEISEEKNFSLFV